MFEIGKEYVVVVHPDTPSNALSYMDLEVREQCTIKITKRINREDGTTSLRFTLPKRDSYDKLLEWAVTQDKELEKLPTSLPKNHEQNKLIVSFKISSGSTTKRKENNEKFIAILTVLCMLTFAAGCGSDKMINGYDHSTIGIASALLDDTAKDPCVKTLAHNLPVNTS